MPPTPTLVGGSSATVLPGWMVPLVLAGAATALALVVYRLRTLDYHVPLDAQREMQIILGEIVGILFVALAFEDVLGPMAAVVAGVVVGYGAVLVAQWAPVADRVAARIGPPDRRRSAGWVVIAGVGLATAAWLPGSLALLSMSLTAIPAGLVLSNAAEYGPQAH